MRYFLAVPVLAWSASAALSSGIVRSRDFNAEALQEQPNCAVCHLRLVQEPAD